MAGINALPGENIAGAGPAPTPAPNSGKKLDNGLLSPSNSVNDASSSKYPDNDGND